MDEHLNPNYPNSRGCFIDRFSKKSEGKILVVDYPTWHFENGDLVLGANDRIPEGKPHSREFSSLAEAKDFVASENYVICTMPRKLDPNRKDKAPIVAEPDEFEND